MTANAGLGFARRWKYRWINFVAGADAMNRRVKVEEELRDMAGGKVPLPDADKCKELYLRLGVETRRWPWTALKKPNAGVKP